MAMNEKQVNIYIDVRDWLSTEVNIRAKKGRFKIRSASEAHAKYDEITRVSGILPNMWEKLQEVYTAREIQRSSIANRVRLRVGQYALLSCVFAEEAYVFDQSMRYRNPGAAVLQSIALLDEYVDRLRTFKKLGLPNSEIIHSSLDDAVRAYSGDVNAEQRPAATLRTLAGLTIRLFDEQTRTSDAILPEPGHKAGEVHYWTQPRLQHVQAPTY